MRGPIPALPGRAAMVATSRARPRGAGIVKRARADADLLLSALLHPRSTAHAHATRDILAFLAAFLDTHVHSINAASPVERARADRILARVRQRTVAWLVARLGDDGVDDGYATDDTDSDADCRGGDGEDITDRISVLIANLSGKGSSGPLRRRFYFPHSRATILLDEPSWCAGDIGSLTWGASVAFANILDARPPLRAHLLSLTHLSSTPPVELGSGTGLGGISLHLIAGLPRLVMSDYHPTVVEVARENVALNESGTGAGEVDGAEGEAGEAGVVVVKADWEEMPEWDEARGVAEESCEVETITTSSGAAPTTPPHRHLHLQRQCPADPVPPRTAPLVLALDVLFHPHHPYLVSRAADRLLHLSPGCEVHVMTPHRIRYEGEEVLFRKEMARRGFGVVWDEVVGEDGRACGVGVGGLVEKGRYGCGGGGVVGAWDEEVGRHEVDAVDEEDWENWEEGEDGEDVRVQKFSYTVFVRGQGAGGRVC
ncbi:hypothetical protein M427DRAFT_66927 [Gonapodya prolifera JEL478]|uniref:S-adenosyl-L-methionine-dependent methyltransferase n=1 Tax=Gonapodya prolifera (strain JEL478) TaxID=1344416 RepID=A0A139ASU8_GONPJ|nr:hypothetical protein M427DRAFT_66927 [Gonapodya prolifera JEL478]|eukprot:KXS19806.1 hypothetical protein M427DRAFT_66927 [Gonapodya prolifera JEL478]